MEKPFNKELFFQLCEEYGVKFSKEYDGIKYQRKDGTIVDLTDDIIDEIFLGDY